MKPFHHALHQDGRLESLYLVEHIHAHALESGKVGKGRKLIDVGLPLTVGLHHDRRVAHILLGSDINVICRNQEAE